MTLNLGKEEIKNGQRVGMGGIVRPAKAGSEVTLHIRRGGKTVAKENVSLDENSRYRFAYKAQKPGNYVVRAIIPGDRENLGAISAADKVRVTR